MWTVGAARPTSCTSGHEGESRLKSYTFDLVTLGYPYWYSEDDNQVIGSEYCQVYESHFLTRR